MNLTCRFKMRFPTLVAVLAVASVAVARPQGGAEKPKTVIPEEISKLLGFRYTIRDIFATGRPYIPLTYETNQQNSRALKNPNERPRKNYLDSNLITDADKLNFDFNYNLSKVWPDRPVHNTNGHYGIPNRRKKPVIHQVLTKWTDNPLRDEQNNWFQLKFKPVTSTTEVNLYPFSTSVSNYIDSSPSAPSEVVIGNTVSISPTGGASNYLERPADPSGPCPAITITSNTIFNKEICPDMNIVINNQIQTNDNVFYDEPIGALEEQPAEYDQEIIPEDEESLGEAETVILDDGPANIDDGLVETAGADNNDNPDFPNLPQLPSRPGSADSEDDDDEGGLFGSGAGLFSWLSLLDPFRFPAVSLLMAPLAALLTGSLGITTFFLPWAVMPSVFLSRSFQGQNMSKSFDGSVNWFLQNQYYEWTGRESFETNVASFIIDLIDNFETKYDNGRRKSRKKRKR